MASSDVSLTLTNVRLSFPKIIHPESFKGADGKDSKPRYSASFLIPKSDTATINAIKAKLLETAVAKWGPDDGAVELKRLIGANKVCFVDGDNLGYDGYAGHYALRTSSTPDYPPTLVDEYAKEMDRNDPKAAMKFYAGCYVNVIIRFWAQGAESGFGKRLNANLGGVQFARDGEAFGGGRVKADAFTPMEPVNAFTTDGKDAVAPTVDDMPW